MRGAVLVAAIAVPVVIVTIVGPVQHGPSFHAYADQRALLGIPHFADVASNAIFLIVGVVGAATRRGALVRAMFAAIAAIGVGSAAYHVAPSDATLVLDWIPIAIASALLTAVNLADRVHRRAGVIAAIAMPAAAIASVIFWYLGGGTDGGDMRWYGLVQGLGVALVPIVIVLYPEGRLTRAWLLAGVAAFVLARVAAASDQALLYAIGVSGHTCKHLLAGVAALCVLRAAGGDPRGLEREARGSGAPPRRSGV